MIVFIGNTKNFDQEKIADLDCKWNHVEILDFDMFILKKRIKEYRIHATMYTQIMFKQQQIIVTPDAAPAMCRILYSVCSLQERPTTTIIKFKLVLKYMFIHFLIKIATRTKEILTYIPLAVYMGSNWGILNRNITTFSRFGSI